MLGLYQSGIAQPLLNDFELIENQQIYSDLNEENIFYYPIGKLIQKVNKTGKPDFQLLSIINNSTSCYDKESKNGFLNLLQFSIVTTDIDSKILATIKKKKEQTLQGKKIILRPLPIQRMEFSLVSVLGLEGSDEVNIEERFSFKNSVWEEKIFTIKLNNRDFQLLQGSAKTGNIALTFSYTIFTEGVEIKNNEPIEISTASSAVNTNVIAIDVEKEMNDSENTSDTISTKKIIATNSFNVGGNLNQWKDLVTEIVSTHIPEGYPSIGVSCFDFVNATRKDLSAKNIIVKVKGIDKRELTQSLVFNAENSAIQYLNFPKPVDMNEPIQYKIIEIKKNGHSNAIPKWKNKDQCKGIIDVTTSHKNIVKDNQQITFEIDLEGFQKNKIKEVLLQVEYDCNGKKETAQLIFNQDNLEVTKSVNVLCEDFKKLKYQTTWEFENGRKRRKPPKYLKETNDAYVYLGTFK